MAASRHFEHGSIEEKGRVEEEKVGRVGARPGRLFHPGAPMLRLRPLPAVSQG